MTKKEQIIIDGVDVSECNFRLERDNQQKCECTHATGFGVICDCHSWQNCYFKQLACKTQLSIKQSKELIRLRKELQESTVKNRNLKQECDELISEKDFYLQKIEVLDLECEELKKQLETSEEWRIKAESLNEKLELRNTRYRKALEEIEGMLQVIVESNKVYPLRSNLYKILDIIRKAKGEEE